LAQGHGRWLLRRGLHGEYAVLARQNGQKVGLYNNEFVCLGNPTLIVAPASAK
jgi:hypothetical protein